MVANLGLRTNEQLYEEIGKIIAEILSTWEKAEWFDEVANHSQRIFTFIKDIYIFFSLHLWHNTLKNRKNIIIN